MEDVFTVHISVRRYETLCTFMQCMYVGRHIRIYVHTCYIAYIHTYIHTYIQARDLARLIRKLEDRSPAHV